MTLSSKMFLTFKIIVGSALAFFFLYHTFTFIDPDLGWHLRTGEWIIAHHHVPIYDLYSYTLPQNKFIAHEWLTESILFALYESGYWTITLLLFFALAFMPLVVWLIRAQSSASLALVALAGIMMSDVIGVRPQVLTFFIFFWCYELLFREINNRARKIFVLFSPLLFFLWANLHGGFVLGLLLWTIHFTCIIITNRYHKREFFSSLSFEFIFYLLSLAATLLTPYGINLWKEIFFTSFSPINHWISEWQPAFIFWQMTLPIFIALSFVFLARSYKSFILSQWGLLLFLFIEAMLHQRMLLDLFVVAIPMVSKAADELFVLLRVATTKIKSSQKPLMLFEYGLVGLSMSVLLCYPFSDGFRTPYTPAFGAAEALNTLCAQKRCGNILNDYDTGGAIIWASPERKIFAAGYMPYWVDEYGYSPLKDLLDASQNSGEYAKLLEKYNIDTVVTLLSRAPIQTEVMNINISQRHIKNILSFLGISKDQTYGHQNDLQYLGWRTVYKDEKTAVLVSPKMFAVFRASREKK